MSEFPVCSLSVASFRSWFSVVLILTDSDFLHVECSILVLIGSVINTLVVPSDFAHFSYESANNNLNLSMLKSNSYTCT